MECRPAFDYARQPHEVHLDQRRPRRHLRIAAPAVRAEERARPLKRSGAGAVAEFTLRGQSGGGVRAAAPRRDGRPVARSERRGRERAAQRDRPLLAGVGRAQPLPRPLARDRDALGAAAETAHVPADRRDRGGPDHQPAGADRRRAQLGLPLYVGARCRIHCVFADAARLHRRGGARSRTSCRRAPERKSRRTGRST